MPHVAIIGAGLAGSLLAIYLAKRGMAVDLYEARGDMRTHKVSAGRSINLALSDRGIAALSEIGMDAYMLAEAVPMYGRMIHSADGEKKLLPYSGREGEYINSVSRAGLNIALINEAEKYEGVSFHFQEPCADFDASSGAVTLASNGIVRADTVIATDGAGSVVRDAMERQLAQFQSSTEYLDHGYKELHIPPGPGGEFRLEKNALHIWPRHQFMMIALPNLDGSFTCTLFLARHAIDSMSDEARLREFFDAEFADAVALMPTLAEDFFANPTGSLGTVRCSPWNAGGRALLLGDSAHAMVPFFGQGMNCAFEDVRILDTLIETHRANWRETFEEFYAERKPNADAIQDMAAENFYEMRDRVADPVFQRKRELETTLEQQFPDYFSKYSMVTFREDLPYAEAKEKGNAQDRLLMEICASAAELDLDDVMTRVRAL